MHSPRLFANQQPVIGESYSKRKKRISTQLGESDSTHRRRERSAACWASPIFLENIFGSVKAYDTSARSEAYSRNMKNATPRPVHPVKYLYKDMKIIKTSINFANTQKQPEDRTAKVKHAADYLTDLDRVSI